MRIRDRLYYYNIELVRVIDGDTIIAHLDRGHNRWERFVHIRLANFNAPEKKGATRVAGEEAMVYLEELLKGKTLFIRTVKTDNFNRFVGRLYLEGERMDIDVAEVMIESAHAVPFMVDTKL